jgi:3',5'-cyclic AMP phosphodiesterase CpdA
MKLIAHISDPHFGTEDTAVAEALFDELDGTTAERPDVIAISGDLTQRARSHQFRAARAFLDALPVPYVVVPGNHDVPVWDMVSRLWRPVARYRRCITEDLYPTYIDDEIAVIGINTAHGITIKGGRITDEQSHHVCTELSTHAAKWRVLVAHHPFVVPHGVPRDDRVDGADAALPRLEDCGLDVILTGHLHVPYSADVAGVRSEDQRVVAVHAGTCMSRRLRGEPNGYNRLELAGDRLTIVHRTWNGQDFIDGPSKSYRRRPVRIAEEPRFARVS